MRTRILLWDSVLSGRFDFYIDFIVSQLYNNFILNQEGVMKPGFFRSTARRVRIPYRKIIAPGKLSGEKMSRKDRERLSKAIRRRDLLPEC